MTSIDLKEVPPDFPYCEHETAADRWFSWSVCDELVGYFCNECKTLRAHAHASDRSIDILYRLYLDACDKGWGTPGELKFVFRHVAARLGWNAPPAVRV